MRFQEAKDKLKGIAGEEYHRIQFELVETGFGDLETKCELYINGYHTIWSGKTWEEAFSKLEAHMNPAVVTEKEVMDMAPEYDLAA